MERKKFLKVFLPSFFQLPVFRPHSPPLPALLPTPTSPFRSLSLYKNIYVCMIYCRDKNYRGKIHVMRFWRLFLSVLLLLLLLLSLFVNDDVYAN